MSEEEVNAKACKLTWKLTKGSDDRDTSDSKVNSDGSDSDYGAPTAATIATLTTLAMALTLTPSSMHS